MWIYLANLVFLGLMVYYYQTIQSFVRKFFIRFFYKIGEQTNLGIISAFKPETVELYRDESYHEVTDAYFAEFVNPPDAADVHKSQ